MSRRTGNTRVVVYIDGFNLYFGLRDSGLRHCYWLNVAQLARNLLRPGQDLVFTKYFTARISGGMAADPPNKRRAMDAKRKRQSDFIEALGTLQDFQTYEGHYLAKPVTCRRCGSTWRTHEEKMTDVQIATELLVDAFDDMFDTALIVSADGDLVPPIRAVRREFRDKRIIVYFPPGRSSVQLKRAANASFGIDAQLIEQSVFPDEVVKHDGFVLRRPAGWK